MNSFYDVFDKMISECKEFYEDIENRCASDEQINAFIEYGSFLNYIPVKRQARVAKLIGWWIIDYNSEYDFYNFFYAPFDDRKQVIFDARLDKKGEEKLLKKEKLANDKSKRLPKDIKKAKAFRATLTNSNETYGHLSNIRLVDMKKRGYMDTPYFKMVDLIDEYIQDLESKTFNMAHELNYRNTPRIHIKKGTLNKYLKRLKKLYDLPCNNNDINTLTKNINPPFLE